MSENKRYDLKFVFVHLAIPVQKSNPSESARPAQFRPLRYLEELGRKNICPQCNIRIQIQETRKVIKPG